MFIDFVLGRVKEEVSLDKVLDLCAAPGGKSTIILDHLDENQFLVANEMIPQRNSVLRENLTKWGYPNFLVTENKPVDFKTLNQYFDCILLDAPCSGEGLFRKDKNARR
jgi:16S rRNA C967 or C1407 C5-methylase (RsmB/RsmF family)